MSEAEEKVYVESHRLYRPLVRDDGYYVMVSHRELDDLIGRLMHLYELNGDVEQRNALKQETKWRCRDWLDNLYKDSGYDKLSDGVQEGARVHDITPQVTVSTTTK